MSVMSRTGSMPNANHSFTPSWHSFASRQRCSVHPKSRDWSGCTSELDVKIQVGYINQALEAARVVPAKCLAVVP